MSKRVSFFISKIMFISVVCLHSAVCFVSNYTWENSDFMETCTCVPHQSSCSGRVTHWAIKFGNHKISEEKLCRGDSGILCCTTFLNETLDAFDQKSAKKTPNKADPSGFKPHKKCGSQNYSYVHWSAALLHRRYRSDNSVLQKCGISLIHQRVALTAAHCLEDKQGFWSVRIGETIRKARKIILHPSFNSTSLKNNMSLIILDKPFSRRIGTVCIASKKYSSLNRNSCQSASWISRSNFDKPVSYLRTVNVSVIPKTKCSQFSELEGFVDGHNNSVCGADGDNCRTAAGEPLICSIPGKPHRFHQLGVRSYGPHSGQSGSVGVFSNVPAFRRWIDNMMIKNGLDIDTYRY